MSWSPQDGFAGLGTSPLSRSRLPRARARGPSRWTPGSSASKPAAAVVIGLIAPLLYLHIDHTLSR